MSARLVVVLGLAVTGAFCFSINGQAALLHHHGCYERVSLGQRLADAALDRSVPLQLLQECETQCSLDLHRCNAFAFGVSSKGNGTCSLSRQIPGKGAGVVEDPDYDLFVKTPDCRVSAPNSCWRLEAARRRPTPEQVRRSLPVQSASLCHDACVQETRFTCRAFAFRFDARGVGRGSCELVETPVSSLQLQHDDDFGVYSLRTCEQQHDGCYVRVQTGHRLDKATGSVSYSVPSLYDCELMCSKEKLFVCLSFSFRYSLDLKFPHENCVVSGRDFRDLDPYRDLIPDRDYDTYTWNQNPNDCLEAQPTSQLAHTHTDCFWRVGSGQRLDRSIIRESLDVRSVADCQRECLASRQFVCRIFSFRYSAPVAGGPVDNCLMSDWPFHELDKYEHLIDDLGFELYERGCEKPVLLDEFSECYVSYERPAQLLPAAVKKALHVQSQHECQVACTQARLAVQFPCSSFSYRSSSAALGGPEPPNCLLSESGLLEGVDYVHEEGHRLFAWNSQDQHCPAGSDPRHPPRPDPYPQKWEHPNKWQYFTVSGRPCRRGTTCSLDQDAGFWSCELEDGDWDYCCRPDHHCGYSQHYEYPWCYVGNSNPEQWRPCNERYFPRQPNHEEPQYWPVAYLHKEPPPNLPPADNSLDGHRADHAKKMKHPADIGHLHNPNDISILIRGSTSIASSEIPSTATVDDDLTAVTFRITDSANSSAPVGQLGDIYTTTKLQPRFVETETHSTIVKSPGRVSKTWHWKAKDATGNVHSK